MTTVFGRDGELEQLESFVSTVAGGPAALVIAGEPGIGKTVLWNAARRTAEDLRHRVLVARPTESEASYSFAGLTDLLEPATGLLPSLPSPQRRALDIALLSADDDTTYPADHRTIAMAALSLIRLLSEEGPVIVAVDDIQWLDAPTVQVLEFVVRRLGDAPVGILVSLRTDQETPDPLNLSAVIPNDRLKILGVGPLTLSALEALLAERLELEVTRPLAARIHEVSGGNPFYALEVGRAIRSRTGELTSGAPLPLSESLRDLVRDRLTRLSPAGARALLVVTAASHPTPEVVRAVMGGEAEPGMADARAAGTIEADRERLRPSHPLIGATAYLELSSDGRRALHSKLAGVVDEPEQKARHMAIATLGPNEEVAAALEAATASAARRGAPGAAAELAEQAVQLSYPDDPARHRRTALAAYHHLRSANIPRAKTLLEEVIANAEPGIERAGSLCLLGEVVYLLGRTPDAITLFQRALAEAGGDPWVSAHIEMDLAMTGFQLIDFSESQRHSHAGLHHAEQAGVESRIGQALAVAVFNDCLVGEGVDEELVERALALEDHDAPTMIWVGPSFVAPMMWLWSGQIDKAKAGFERMLQILLERGQDASICLMGVYVTKAVSWSGDLKGAETYAQAAKLASEHSGWAAGRAFAAASGAMVDCFAGREEAARRKIEEASAIFGDHSPVRTLWMMSCLGAMEVSLGNYAEADRVLGRYLRLIQTSGAGEPGVLAFVADEAEALIGLDRAAEAQPIIDWLEERGTALDRPWALAAAGRCRSLKLASEGRAAEALEAVHEALIHHKRLPMPIELARTLLVKGRVLRRNREKSAAKESLDEALAIFEATGALAWADRTREELDRIGLRPRASSGLTATESQVAELAAAGMSTKKIAAEAFISPKTVEGVLTRVYRKLGVSSRAQLAAKLARQKDTPEA